MPHKEVLSLRIELQKHPFIKEENTLKYDLKINYNEITVNSLASHTNNQTIFKTRLMKYKM